MVSNLRGTTEARISYKAHGIPNGFSPSAALHIYRIAQELLANAITHAKASSIAFTITGAQDHLTIEVSDDGIGLGEAHTGRGIGSTIIRERVTALHGTLSADTNDGTQLRVDIPTSNNLKDAL